MSGITFTQEQLAAIIAAGGSTQPAQPRRKALPGTNVIPSQGPGGLMSGMMEREVYNDFGLPQLGLMGCLPLFRSQKGAIAYSIISGMSDTSNPDGTPAGAGGPAEADGMCDPFPEAGTLSSCTFCAPFGRFGRQSRVINLTDLDNDNYCDTDLQMIGMPGMDGPDVTGLSPNFPSAGGDILNNTIAKALFELKVAFHRDYPQQLWTGDPGNNTAGGGYKESWGMDRLMNTGYIDMISGLPCPAADAQVLDYGNALIDDDPCAFKNAVVSEWRKAQYRASADGLGPVGGKFVGPRELFDAMVEAWKCCGVGKDCPADCSNDVVTTRSQDAVDRMYLQMKERMMIPVDGVQVPFEIDDTAPHVKGATFSSSLWFIPLTANGGRSQITYRQYKGFNQTEARAAMRLFGTGNIHRVLGNPNGAWFAWTCWEGPCLRVNAVTQQRLVVRKPALGFRIDNVDFTPCVDYPDLDLGGGAEAMALVDCPPPN